MLSPPEDRQRAGAQSARGMKSSSKKPDNRPGTATVSIYERSQKFSHIQCPYCNRKFSEKAGSRHIAYCKEKAEL